MQDLITARRLHVLADCHIGRGVDWSPALLDALAGVDLFVTLGDMGQRIGLDALSEIAPVIGVRGMDDEDDPRTAVGTRILSAQGVRMGCVFDPVASGLARTKDRPLAILPEALLNLFGDPVDVLLWASTHVPSIDRMGDLLLVNPGSATLPDAGTRAAFARLVLSNGTADAELVTL